MEFKPWNLRKHVNLHLKGSTNQTLGWKQEKNGVQAETMGFAEQQLGLSERMDLNTPKHGKLNRHFSIGTTTSYCDEHYYRSHMFSVLLRFLFSLLIRSPLFQRLILDMICFKKTTIINYQQSWNSSNQLLSLSLPIIHWFILPHSTHGWFIFFAEACAERPHHAHPHHGGHWSQRTIRRVKPTNHHL